LISGKRDERTPVHKRLAGESVGQPHGDRSFPLLDACLDVVCYGPDLGSGPNLKERTRQSRSDPIRLKARQADTMLEPHLRFFHHWKRPPPKRLLSARTNRPMQWRRCGSASRSTTSRWTMRILAHTYKIWRTGHVQSSSTEAVASAVIRIDLCARGVARSCPLHQAATKTATASDLGRRLTCFS
jgi:hypothetical protein